MRPPRPTPRLGRARQPATSSDGEGIAAAPIGGWAMAAGGRTMCMGGRA
jgi:hypothetical protein